VALRDVDLEVRPGEFLAVVGPNGSGKSTLAKHLNGLLLPTAGDVWVAGINTRERDRIWEVRRITGMVFQNPDNQLVATVVEEDVAFGPENLGLHPDEIRRRVDEALGLVRMEPYRRHAPHLLSGGQKQRVAIAGVLAMRPRVLVFDEATAMLDPVGRSEVLETAHRLNREEGLTVVHITHFMEEAVAADRVAVMDRGGIALLGPPAEVFGQAELLRRLGLELPAMAELAAALRRAGLPVPPDVLDVPRMFEYLVGVA